MKKLIYMGAGLLLCLSFSLWTGCDRPDEENLNETSQEIPEITMVYVEGGSFSMGATEEQLETAIRDEKPVHNVTLDGYYIGQYEITQGQWKAVMGTTVEQQRVNADPSWKLYGMGDDYPIYYVSWEEAKLFCEKLSAQTGEKYRLPTEAEWEYAARGGNRADGTKYAGSNDFNNVAWCQANSEAVHPVGQKRPNGLGLYDMSGNVWEWCQDWFGDYSSSPSVNPQGPSVGSNRVFRGGSWYFPGESCRISYRSSILDKPAWYIQIGFRVVRER